MIGNISKGYTLSAVLRRRVNVIKLSAPKSEAESAAFLNFRLFVGALNQFLFFLHDLLKCFAGIMFSPPLFHPSLELSLFDNQITHIYVKICRNQTYKFSETILLWNVQ